MQKVVVFDVETSGLDPQQHEIIQFAAVVCGEQWEPLAELELKLKFNVVKASPEALELNSFDPEEWAAKAISPAEAVARIGNFLKLHATLTKTSKAGKPYQVARLCGHNARTFDCPFLAALFKSQGGAFCPAAIYEPLDTLELARWVTFAQGAAIENHKLETICAYLGIPETGDAHDALGDVRRTAELAKRLAALLGQPVAV